MADIKKVEDTIAPHIINIQKGEVLGIAVLSVEFTPEFRAFIAIIAKSLLSELNPFKSNAEHFLKVYQSVNLIYTRFNEMNVVPAHVIRNGIVMLNMRIEHCEREKASGEWILHDNSNNFLAPEKLKYFLYTQMSEGVISKNYNEATLEAMKRAKDILLSSLINITDEFE
jgi:hypothetical protein